MINPKLFIFVWSIALLFIFALAYAAYGSPSDAKPRHILPIKIISAIDGDSYRVVVAPWPGQHNEAILRLNGWDAPESTWRAECDAEGKLGVRATEVADSLVRASHVRELVSPSWDKYGGRVLGTLLLDGEDIGEQLAVKGLLKAYTGKGDKPDWCNGKGTL